MNDAKVFTHPLLTEAGIKSIPYDKNGCFAPIYIPSDGKGTAEELALIAGWYGGNPLMLAAAKEALAWTMKSAPLPKIYIVEAQRDGDRRCFDSLGGISYVPRTLSPESEGIWLKEALWGIGAREAVKDGYTKLVFIDLDCSFLKQDWAIDVSNALDKNDVISPYLGYYRAGQRDWLTTGIYLSRGYTYVTKGTCIGAPGIAKGMTSAFFTNQFKSQMPVFVDSATDHYIWVMLRPSFGSLFSDRFPHILDKGEPKPLDPLPRIGYAHQIIVHHPHGSQASRHYWAKHAVTRECFPKFGDGVRIMSDGMPCFSDPARGAVMKKTLAAIATATRSWTQAEAGELTRRNLKEAGLEIYSIPRK